MTAHPIAARVLKLALALAIGIAAGLAVKAGLQTGAVQAAAARVMQVFRGGPASGAVTGPQAFHLPPAAASLDASVLVAGEVHSARSGRIALPTGTRFQLGISSDNAGTVAIHAINPQGVQSPAPVWTGTVGAGAQIQTPALRLEGTRGLETLRVVLRAASGETLAERDVQIWHL